MVDYLFTKSIHTCYHSDQASTFCRC